jgi:hypothetical protein
MLSKGNRKGCPYIKDVGATFTVALLLCYVFTEGSISKEIDPFFKKNRRDFCLTRAIRDKGFSVKRDTKTTKHTYLKKKEVR